jgi:hypothetical protein
MNRPQYAGEQTMANQDYTTRICPSCKKEYPRTAEFFFRNKGLPDGLSYRCKECCNRDKKSRFKDEPCPVCGGKVPAQNGKYCSNECQGIGTKGIERPSMKGRKTWATGLTNETSEKVRKISEAKKKNVVDAETLHRLYVEEDMTLKAIGDIYGVSKHVIKRLAGEYGLKRKRELLTEELVIHLYESGMSFVDIGREYNCSPSYVAQNFGQSVEARRFHSKDGSRMPFETRDGRVVTKEMLQELYTDQWLSYEEIAEILSVDFTTIPYWLKKLGIATRTAWETRRGATWVEPKAETLIHLYQSDKMGMDAIGALFGTSKEYVQRILRDNGIAIRKSGYPNIPNYVAQDGHKVKSSLELQVDNWLYLNGVLHIYEPRIKGTRYKGDFLVGDTYIEIWGLVGHEKYDEKKAKKIAAYEQAGLKLLSVYPSDFPDLTILETLLRN